MMRLIEFQASEPAQMLMDYLRSRGLDCRLDETDVGYAVVLLNENQHQLAQDEVARFLREPNHPRYREASWENSQPAKFGLSKDGLFTELFLQIQPFMLCIFVACLAIFLIQFIFPAVIPSFLFAWPWEGGQVWRLITPAFLHFSWLHLIFNLAWWWYLASRMEQRYGMAKLIILFCAAAVIPNILQAMLVGPAFGGLSGVTYSLLGYLWLKERNQASDTSQSVSDGLFIFVVGWLVLGFTGVFGLNAANFAHLGGLMIGLVQGWRERNA